MLNLKSLPDMKHPGNLDTMKRPNPRIIRIEEDSHLKVPGHTFNKIIEDNFPNLRKEMPVKEQETYRTSKKIGPEKKVPYHIIIKTQNVQNKE